MVPTPAATKDLFLFRNVHTDCAAYAATQSGGTGLHSRGSSCRGAKLTTHLPQAPQFNKCIYPPILNELRVVLDTWGRETFFILLKVAQPTQSQY
jgi:hypothetical protein